MSSMKLIDTLLKSTILRYNKEPNSVLSRASYLEIEKLGSDLYKIFFIFYSEKNENINHLLNGEIQFIIKYEDSTTEDVWCTKEKDCIYAEVKIKKYVEDSCLRVHFNDGSRWTCNVYGFNGERIGQMPNDGIQIGNMYVKGVQNGIVLKKLNGNGEIFLVDNEPFDAGIALAKYSQQLLKVEENKIKGTRKKK